MPFDAPPKTAITWIVRNGNALQDTVETFALPAGEGFAYIIGETAKVRVIRHRLLERGIARNRIAAEGYWRPGRVGGHDHV
jgi:NADPH-dependent ferric siderophore reductase